MRSVRARDRRRRSEDRSKSRHMVGWTRRGLSCAISMEPCFIVGVETHPWLWPLFDGVSSSLALRFPSVSVDMVPATIFEWIVWHCCVDANPPCHHAIIMMGTFADTTVQIRLWPASIVNGCGRGTNPIILVMFLGKEYLIFFSVFDDCGDVTDAFFLFHQRPALIKHCCTGRQGLLQCNTAWSLACATC